VSQGGRPASGLGRAGETLAAEHLEAKGLRILDRGFRTRAGEIDLVADESGVLVFVEVKARSSLQSGRPAEAVNARKRLRMLKAARLWLLRHDTGETPCRFDVVEILARGDSRPLIHHIRDAFQTDRA
jgi:putative endonuclease